MAGMAGVGEGGCVIDTSVNQSQECSVPVGNSICGEVNSLEIMKEFNRLYEERMLQIDTEAGGDCLQEKMKLQQEWIKNLTQQNEMLVRAVHELEYEATEKVQHLEEKLHKSAECLWEDEKMLEEKDRTVHDLTKKLNYYDTFGDVEGMAKELKCKQEECESLKQEMRDMRKVFAEKIALKHDQIITMRKDIQILQNKSFQADKQTTFNEDFIRELKKEAEQQVSPSENPLKLHKSGFSQKDIEKSRSKLLGDLSRTEFEHPYLIINHISKKQDGKNTVIFITKDGSVHKEITTPDFGLNTSENKSKHHTEVCQKCRNKLSNKKSHLPACKSEGALIEMKNMLRPVKDRSKLTNTTFERCKTFVDRTKNVLNETELDKTHFNTVPVKSLVYKLERK